MWERRDEWFLGLWPLVETINEGGMNIPTIIGVGVSERAGGTKGRGELGETVSIEVANRRREDNTGEGWVSD